MLPEQYAFALLIAGNALALIGYLWLVIRAFGTSLGWGLGTLILAPVGLVYALLHFRRALWPLVLILVGVILASSPIILNLVAGEKVQVTAQEEKKTITVPDGTIVVEERVTLTGATREEYTKLAGKSFAVVQWANPDVTDADVAALKGMTSLREIDLNGTQVTDATLKLLAELPALEVVRIARTKVTPEGVETHLLSRPKLKEIDVRGVKVPRATMQKWKDADRDNRKFSL